MSDTHGQSEKSQSEKGETKEKPSEEVQSEKSRVDKFDHREFLAHVNGLPGVYRMIDRNDKVIYVGKAKNLRKRVTSYFRKNEKSPKKRRKIVKPSENGFMKSH